MLSAGTFDPVKGAAPDLAAAGNIIPRGLAPGKYYVGMIIQSSGDTNPADNTSEALHVTVTHLLQCPDESYSFVESYVF